MASSRLLPPIMKDKGAVATPLTLHYWCDSDNDEFPQTREFLAAIARKALCRHSVINNAVRACVIVSKSLVSVEFKTADDLETYVKLSPIQLAGREFHVSRSEKVNTEKVARKIPVLVHRWPRALDREPVMRFLEKFGRVEEVYELTVGGPFPDVYNGSMKVIMGSINTQAGIPRRQEILGHSIQFYHRGQVTDWPERRRIQNEERSVLREIEERKQKAAERRWREQWERNENNGCGDGDTAAAAAKEIVEYILDNVQLTSQAATETSDAELLMESEELERRSNTEKETLRKGKLKARQRISLR